MSTYVRDYKGVVDGIEYILYRPSESLDHCTFPVSELGSYIEKDCKRAGNVRLEFTRTPIGQSAAATSKLRTSNSHANKIL